MSYRGHFKITKPEKYMTNDQRIQYDSLWEYRFMKYCESSDVILKWCREPFHILYLSPKDLKTHKYYPDFYIECIDKTGKVSKHVIEIKPDKQTRPPKKKLTKKTLRPTRRYLNESLTFNINTSKWSAATKFCEERGLEFTILTEKNSNFGRR